MWLLRLGLSRKHRNLMSQALTAIHDIMKMENLLPTVRTGM